MTTFVWPAMFPAQPVQLQQHLALLARQATSTKQAHLEYALVCAQQDNTWERRRAQPALQVVNFAMPEHWMAAAIQLRVLFATELDILLMEQLAALLHQGALLVRLLPQSIMSACFATCPV